MVEFDFLEKGLLVSRVLLLKRMMTNEHKVLRISLNLMFGWIVTLEIDQNALFKLAKCLSIETIEAAVVAFPHRSSSGCSIGIGSTTTFVVANSALDDHPHIDLAIDGDKVEPNFDFFKGRGRAFLREKMVEAASEKFIAVVDDTKLVSILGGSGLAMLVEVVQTLIKDSAITGKEIVAFEGVVEHGLFLDMTMVVIIAVIIAGKEGVSVKSK
ncbi:hypothetical protein CQW23_21167 [Capsicum baccatum]|uniref:ribose-5-phosphate isomerase n=1 Tax=Capsicum baccatum TaxID=33114 RepID=A0A2G2VX82_CAPBA|nr:hypothetical protein CQW23_21167 [Capsicum baccatum]